MLIRGKYKSKHALVITEDILRELDDVLKIGEKSNVYSAKLVNESVVEFENLEELLNFENFQDQKIFSLSVNPSHRDRHLYIGTEGDYPVIRRYIHSAVLTYSVNSSEEELTLRERVGKILEKARAQYSPLYKININSCFWLFSLTSFLLLSIFALPSTAGSPKESVTISASTLAIVLVSVLAVVLGVYLLGRFWKKILPPVVFCTGEGQSEFRKLSKKRQNLFWGVFIALVISALVAVFTNLVF